MQADGETVEFHCGEQTRRPAEESYVHSKVGSEGGKMILNVESKRHQGALRHAHTKPELRKYSPFGPHNSQTRMGGTFGLRQLLPYIFSEPDQVRVIARVSPHSRRHRTPNPFTSLACDARAGRVCYYRRPMRGKPSSTTIASCSSGSSC